MGKKSNKQQIALEDVVPSEEAPPVGDRQLCTGAEASEEELSDKFGDAEFALKDVTVQRKGVSQELHGGKGAGFQANGP